MINSESTDDPLDLIRMLQTQQFDAAVLALESHPDMQLLHSVDKKNNNALHWACFHNNEQISIMILKHINRCDELTISQFLLAKNEDDYSPFHLAVYRGNTNLVQMMLKYPLDIYVQARKGLTVLHLAAQGNHPQLIHFFLRLGMPVDLLNASKGSALHYAAFSKSAECVMYLLSRNAEINLRDSDGVTPLYLAALQMDNTFIASKLMKQGANPKLRTNSGVDAIEAARGKNNTDMVRLLTRSTNNILDVININPSKPYRRIPLLTFFLLYGVSSLLFMLFQVPYIKEDLLTWVIVIIWTASSLGFIVCWLRNPGFIGGKHQRKDLQSELECLSQQNDNQEICFECILTRPTRSRHCYTCGRCVAVYDHHCPWINNCVGARNHSAFIVFVAGTFFSSLFISLAVLLNFSSDEIENESFAWFEESTMKVWHKISAIFLVLIAIPSCLTLSVLLKVQIGNLILGRTTYERFSAGQTIDSNNPDKTQTGESQDDDNDVENRNGNMGDVEDLSQQQHQQQQRLLLVQKRRNGSKSAFRNVVDMCLLNQREKKYFDDQAM